jgi:hypothetical protein
VCEKDFKTETKRYYHLIEGHGFPNNWSSKELLHPPRMRPRKVAQQENKEKVLFVLLFVFPFCFCSLKITDEIRER